MLSANTAINSHMRFGCPGVSKLFLAEAGILETHRCKVAPERDFACKHFTLAS